jgi:hypothetical protein
LAGHHRRQMNFLRSVISTMVAGEKIVAPRKQGLKALVRDFQKIH